jgi:hypothetical protein
MVFSGSIRSNYHFNLLVKYTPPFLALRDGALRVCGCAAAFWFLGSLLRVPAVFPFVVVNLNNSHGTAGLLRPHSFIPPLAAVNILLVSGAAGN